MAELLHSEITQEIIGAASEVHGTLGAGFLESIYEEALCHELRLRSMSFERQVHVLFITSAPIGKHVLDLIIEEKVVVELKAISELADVHRGIVLSYLAATRLPVALLFNFGQPSLACKRIVRQKRGA